MRFPASPSALVSILLLFVSGTAWCQYPVLPNLVDEHGKRTGHWSIWYDSSFNIVHTPDSVVFYRLIKFEAGVPSGKIRDFSRTGYKYWEGYAKNIDPYVFHGESNHYHENGRLQYRQIYVDGKREGPIVEYYSNGRKKSEGAFRNDKENGPWKYYFDDGRSEVELTYLDGNKIGPVKFFHTNGTVSSTGFYKDNKFDGAWTSYSDTGKKTSHSNYKADSLDGPYEAYHENGAVKERSTFRSGKRIGAYISYFDNGKIETTGRYDDNGKMAGPWVYNHSSGKLYSHGLLKNDMYEGAWEYFYDNGQLSKKGSFVDGRSTGEWKEWYEDGTPTSIANYRNDSLSGVFIMYHPNGKKESEGVYENGLLNGVKRSYNESGILVSEGEFVDGNSDGEWKFYYDTGELSFLGYYLDGQYHGEAINYFQSGKINDRSFFKNGQRDSLYISYHENGQVNGTGYYVDGVKKGEWRWNYPNGNPQTVAYYENDLENGPITYYFENGKLNSQSERKDGVVFGASKFYYANGNLSQEGSFLEGQYQGKWIRYDSASGRVLDKSDFDKGVRHGFTDTYDEAGEFTRRYYIRGWEETSGNIRDSVEHLVRIKDYDNALKLVDWMVRVEKRDYKSKADRILSQSIYGLVYSAKSDYKNALKWNKKYMESVAKYSGKNTDTYRIAVHNVASALHGLGNYVEALKYYDEAIAIAKPAGLVESYWSTVNNKVYCLFDAGRVEEAAVLFATELDASTALHGNSSAGWYLRHEVAQYYFDRVKDYDRSLTMFNELLTDITSANDLDHDFAFDCNQRMGEIYYDKYSQFDNSVKYFEDAVAFAERKGRTDWPAYADMLVDLFYIHKDNRAVDELAASKYDSISTRLLKITDRIADPKARAEVLLAVGNYYYDKADNKTAYDYFLRSEEAFVKAGFERTLRHASVLQSLAFASYYTDRAHHEASEVYFEYSMGIREQLLDHKSQAYYSSRFQFASFYSMIEVYDKALEIFEDVRKVATEANDEATVAKCDYSIGEVYYLLWQYDAAIPYFEKTVAYAETQGDRFANDHVMSLSYIARCHKFRDEQEQAIEIERKALAMSEQYFGKQNGNYFYRLSALGNIYEYGSLYSEAIKYYVEAADGFKELYGEASTQYITEYRNVIKVWSQMSEHKKVIDYGDQMLDYIRQNFGQDSDPFLELVYIVADSYASLKTFDTAEEYFKTAVEVSSSINGVESPMTASHFSRLGKFYQKRNRIEEAEETLLEAVGIMERSSYGKSQVVSSYLVDLANVMLQQDKNKEAESLFNRAFTLAQTDTINSISTYVTAGQELARFYDQMGRFKEASRMLKRLTSLIERTYGKRYYYASVRERLVLIYLRLSLYSEAEQEAKDLLSLLEDEVSNDHWLVLTLHNYLGIMYDDQRQFAKAADEFNYCLSAMLRKTSVTEVEQSSIATYHNNLARIDLSLGRDEEARKHLAECDRIRKSIGELQGQVESAVYQSNLADYYQATGQMAKAEETWTALTNSLLSYSQNNFYFMSDEEKAQFWKNISGYFNVFQSFAVQRAPKNPAITANMYNVRLATKAILLSASNKIRKRILSSRDTTMVRMYYRWTNMREHLAQLYSSPSNDPSQKITIDSLQTSAQLLEKEMNISAEDLSNDKGGGAVTWKNVQSQLAPDEAAVEIIRFKHYDRYSRDSVIYAALILTSETKQYPKLVYFKDGNLMENRYLKYYRNSMAIKSADTISYREYWSPLEASLKGKTRVYLSLDGVFNQINLNTLMDRKGAYLVDSKNLTILSNTKDLLAIKSRKLKRISLSSATLFGFPSYFVGNDKNRETPGSTRDFDANAMETTDRTGITPLLGTRDEIQKIGSILESHKMHADVYMSEMASENTIKKLQHPRVLHIATHGFFIEDLESSLATALGSQNNPLLRAGLLLAGASNFIQSHDRLDEENGVLTAYEAANLDLDNTDLVVLSACETGKGEVQNGEGVYGLQRAFQTAGAQTIVMSLWKVDDAATQQLMTSFYSNWMTGMAKADALKNAQVELKRQYPHPYYWGAFVMLEN